MLYIQISNIQFYFEHTVYMFLHMYKIVFYYIHIHTHIYTEESAVPNVQNLLVLNSLIRKRGNLYIYVHSIIITVHSIFVKF